MDLENINYKCKICGEEFTTRYNAGGAIEHNNAITSHNVEVIISRFDSDEWYKDIAITSIGNDVRDLKTRLVILNCVLKRLIPFNREDVRQAIMEFIEELQGEK